jgi:hypothetical protein
VVRPKSQPSKIDELALLVHPRNGHRKIFAMIEAYIDESGIHGDATVCVVAGYFGRRNHWNHFESAWRKVLHRFDFLLADFHAKDQIKSTKHAPMLLELAKTIGKFQVYPVSMTLVVDDFKLFSQERKRWLTGASFHRGKLVTSGAPSKPYFVPFQLLIQRVTDYAKVGTKAHFFCGLDRQFSEYARALFAKIKSDPPRPGSEWISKPRVGDIAFPMASETPELQAADLLAHLTYLHMAERSEANNWSAKPSGLLALCLRNTRSWTNDHAYQDKKALVATFEKARQLTEKRRNRASMKPTAEHERKG